MCMYCTASHMTCMIYIYIYISLNLVVWHCVTRHTTKWCVYYNKFYMYFMYLTFPPPLILRLSLMYLPHWMGPHHPVALYQYELRKRTSSLCSFLSLTNTHTQTHTHTHTHRHRHRHTHTHTQTHTHTHTHTHRERER